MICWFAVIAALPQAVEGAGLFVCENARARNDLGLLRMRQRDLNDVDAEQRRIRVLRGVSARAARQFVCLANAACAVI